MLKALKSFLGSLGNAEEAPRFADTDHRVAAAALLVHVMAVDGKMAPIEHQRLTTLLQREFSLDEGEVEDLLAEATRRDREAIDLYGFTSVVKRGLDEAGRQRIVSLMWEMVYVDGTVTEFEDNLIWRVAELLGVGTRDRVRLRKEVEGGQEDDDA